MEEINLSRNGGRRANRDWTQANSDRKRPASFSAERIRPEIQLSVVDSWTRVLCCIALWVLASRQLAIAFGCSEVAALVALWIALSVSLVVGGVVATLWKDRGCSQGAK